MEGEIMGEVKVFELNVGVMALNDSIADEIREINKEHGTFLVNIMSSPGSGKSTTLLRTISDLKDKYSIGVMEADIAAVVDAEKMRDAGVRTIQVHTGGECSMDASMTKSALEGFREEFPDDKMDLVFLENIGNLVCTAEQDTGANINVEILSVPEGDDKPLKYPLMFTVADVVLVNKIDTVKFFKFDRDAVVERIHALNPDSKIIFLSSKTGEGFDEWTSWLSEKIEESRR